MALTKTVTKLWPTRNADDTTFFPGIHLVLKEADVVVLEQDFRSPYGGGGQLPEARDRITKAAQAAIDKYKAEKAINDAGAYTTAVAAIDAALAL
jgi:hypothetical protein